ncbi:phosphoribosyltransferase-like protein [Xanthomonas oryzae]|uniref:PRTase-CE domain-containing protein n=1 Tax=Xanthomonas oryzae pv. leersiae TaxID=3112258 RepID=A0AAJ6KPR6_9XANT|nr:hypothetical protein [Xanthomonas oryzae]WIX07560.1 hypothetical protein QN060_05700 [Xanthomonas oryzae pv. oryzae]
MSNISIAIALKDSTRAFKLWDDISAGQWRRHITVIDLSSDKDANNALIASKALTANVTILAMSHLTSGHLATSHSNVRRLRRHEMMKEVTRWLDTQNLAYLNHAKRQCDKTPFHCTSPESWLDQFSQVDPNMGRRAGAALLAQLQVFDARDFSGFFRDLPEDVDTSCYFLGADPHSGDHALISILSAVIDNTKLNDSRALPKMSASGKLRLFCDGAWSGGETKRRIRCLFTPCTGKKVHLSPTHRLDVRLGFITSTAQKAIEKEVTNLVQEKLASVGSIQIQSARENLLQLRGDKSGQVGLAFHDTTLLDYVDSDRKSLAALCKKIGLQLHPKKPLGTNEIASCIAFAHSLPSAMLPLFITKNSNVKAHDGTSFEWKPLLSSQHHSTGLPDDPSHHCEACPLVDRSKTPSNHNLNSPPISDS